MTIKKEIVKLRRKIRKKQRTSSKKLVQGKEKEIIRFYNKVINILQYLYHHRVARLSDRFTRQE